MSVGPNAIALNGKNKSYAQIAMLISVKKELILCLDADAYKLADEYAQLLLRYQSEVWITKLPSEDPNYHFVRGNLPELLNKTTKRANTKILGGIG